ncbi:MAG: DUF4976 domain-containing protein [Bryobacteraceae bacterium]|nr:DUF4976 domain-containing protein [Bryobacteraceae bacterium]MDW8379968.1 DUF4976 domain-containing protein [Bryobacterales bacterium]
MRRNFPQTPTIPALCGERYQFIGYHGIWDSDELYDLQQDPLETNNLIDSEAHQKIVSRMRARLFEILEQRGGQQIPLWPDRGNPQNLRSPKGSPVADFPPELKRSPRRPPRK